VSAARELLRAGLAELGIDPAKLPALEELAALLAQWADRLNLTAHRTPEAIAGRLILDALALGEVLPEAPPASIADLGSGAGFPGLPLAIRWPESRVTLIEARERRHHFQRTAIRMLGTPNARPLLGRAELLEPSPHAIVVAQAAAQPEVALAWMARWAGPGSWLVLPRSEDPEPFAAPTGVFHVETRYYRVPCSGVRRQVWIGRAEHPIR